jgi:hypothetical protein
MAFSNRFGTPYTRRTEEEKSKIKKNGLGVDGLGG